MHQTETERDHPSSLDLTTDDVLEGHVHDRNRDESFNQRRKPQRVGTDIVRRCNQSYRVSDGKRGDNLDQRAKSAERYHQTEQEQQMVGAIENVQEAGTNEAQRGLKPARIEANESRVAFELECSNSATRRQKSQHAYDSKSQNAQTWLNRKPGSIRFDLILEH